jgi:trehalose-phosphatase
MAKNSEHPDTQTLLPSAALADFYQRLRTAPERALLLDYDGTLAPFRIHRDEALPYAGVREILDAIMDSGHTRLVIVSGRWTRDLTPLLGLKRLPEIWGSHGWEQLKPDGGYAVTRIDENSLQKLVEADDWINDIERCGGRCERKPGSLAIHWRGLPPEKIGAIRERVSEGWRTGRMQENLVWHDFDGGIELRAPGPHKGFAVDAVLSGMGPRTVAAYLGDDQTDEDAFEAIQGRGIGVLVRPQFRATAADVWLQPPAGLLEFLQRWHDNSGAAR